MKNTLVLLSILILASCKKEAFNPNLTREFSIQSLSNGANYSIQVGLPENYNPESQKYAVLYLLDGEEIFTDVAENCKTISADYATSNVLVVSIGYGNDRATDYTPTIASEGKGGAENFMLFIKNELVPKMESDFAADTSRKSRIILGHSFGGLFGSYAFTNHNEVFGNYILLSPSLWYDNEIILRLELEHRNINKIHHQLVFMGLGEMENGGRMLAPFQAFYQHLENNYPDIEIKRHLEPYEDHRGSKKPNILEGLHYYFQHR
ncbi:MAG TPA: alpha/beta hydrolase-fold protein [Bacteroidia bacterium]|nr:alpha/beta hydrolase-fold protein [Bacteroidia bacterium]